MLEPLCPRSVRGHSDSPGQQSNGEMVLTMDGRPCRSLVMVGQAHAAVD